jgi:hypothetical protein
VIRDRAVADHLLMAMDFVDISCVSAGAGLVLRS